MPTNDYKVNIYEKRLLSKTALKANFLDFLVDEIDEIVAAVFQGTAGVLDALTIGLLTDGANNKFKLDLTNASRVVVGTGEIIDLSQITGTSITEGIQFEDDGSSTYYVGVRFMEMPDDVETNPRSGDPEYPSLKQTFGEKDNPGSVTDNTTYIRLNINSITESGVDHSGRTVTVWLVDPISHVQSVAFFQGTSGYSSPNNYVDIPYSGANGPLGQDTGVSPPSTTATDYMVAIEGVTWRKNTDLRLDSDYAFIGTITSTGGAPTFSIVDQVPVFIITLDRAYDGATGTGGGRQVTVDAGAVEFSTAGSSADLMNAQFRLSRNGSTENMQFMLQAILEDEETIPIAALEALRDGTALLETETVTLSGATVTFTRGGSLDLQDLSLRINPNIQILLLDNCDVSADDGLYLIYAVPSSSTLTVRDLDGTVTSFTATTGQATILHPAFIVSNGTPNPLVGTGVTDYWEGFLLSLRDGQENAKSMHILPEKGGAIYIYDNGKLSPSTYGTDTVPRELVVIDPSLVGQNLKWPVNLKRSTLVAGGVATGGAGEEPFYNRDGLRIHDAFGQVTERDAAFAFAVDYGWPEDVPTLHTWPSFAVDLNGGVDRGHHFRDDFIFHPRGSFSTLGPYFTGYSGGSGNAYVRDISDGAGYGHGAIELVTAAATDAVAQFGLDNLFANLDTDYDFRWVYRARLKMTSLLNYKCVHGFYNAASARKWYFIYNYINNEYYWRGGWMEAGPTYYQTDPICGATADEYQWFEISISPTSVTFTIERKDHAANSYGTAVASHATLSGQSGGAGVELYTQAKSAVAKACTLDYWEVWDREVIKGRFGTSHNLNHP